MSAVNANVVVADPVTGERYYVEAGSEPSKEVAALLGDHLFDSPEGHVKKAAAKQSSAKK